MNHTNLHFNKGTIIGVAKEDTRIFDYGSCRVYRAMQHSKQKRDVGPIGDNTHASSSSNLWRFPAQLMYCTGLAVLALTAFLAKANP